jgi:hypothetical protein
MRFLLWLAVFASSAFALETAYVTFEHPDGWRCELSQGVWICQSTVDPDRKESVILSIATIATEWDSIDNYAEYLKQVRTIQDEEGNTVTAKVTYARKRNINGNIWVDSLQFNSELPGFYARYLATVHQAGATKLAILITYIVSESNYSKLAPQFERMVASLRTREDFDINVASKQGDGPLPFGGKLGPAAQKDLLSERLNVKKKPEKKEDSGGVPYLMYGLIASIVGVVALMLRKRKSKRGGGKPSAGGGVAASGAAPPPAGKKKSSSRGQGPKS